MLPNRRNARGNIVDANLANTEENQEHFEGALVGLADDFVSGNDGTFCLLQFFTARLKQLPECHSGNTTKPARPEQ